MKKFFIDLLCCLGLFLAADIVYRLLFWMFTWGLTWSDTVIALFIFMGCPIVFTGAWWSAVGIGSIPIRTKFWLVISELILLYCGILGVYTVWHIFQSINGGWEIVLKVVYSLFYLGVYIMSGIFLFINSKDRWNDNLK